MTEKQLPEIAREERNRYKREWYQKNKDHVREYHRKYRQEHSEKLKTINNQYWQKKALERLEKEKESKCDAGTKNENPA